VGYLTGGSQQLVHIRQFFAAIRFAWIDPLISVDPRAPDGMAHDCS
jgi:hypothetical protein